MVKISHYILIIGTLVIASCLFLIYKNRSEDEDFLFLKLIGYFFLGSFRFVLNGVPIPLGFFVFMFFIKPKINRRTKSLSVYLGIFTLVLSLLIPVISNLYFERNREILATEKNLNLINFEKEWSFVQTALDLPGNTKVNSFNIHYEENGEILDFDYELITLVDGNYTFYRVNFSPSRKVYTIKPKKVEQWLQFDRLVPAERFFKVLDNLDFVENRLNGEYESYRIASQGDFISYLVKGRQKFFVSDSKLTKISDQELPIEGYWISTYGNKKVSENSTEGAGYIDYLFN